MGFVVFEIKIVLSCVGVGVLGGACAVVLDYMICLIFGLNLSSFEGWFAFGSFSIFGLVAGVVSAFRIRLPKFPK
jgi:hypothetical protein